MILGILMLAFVIVSFTFGWTQGRRYGRYESGRAP